MKYYSTKVVIDSETLEILEKDIVPYAGPWALADRSLQNAASKGITNANSVGSNLGATASSERSALLPGLESEANNPTGYTPTQTNNQLVAGEQGAGGANSGLTGEAMLHMARTRNAGGYGAALDQAARDKTKALSGNALNVENQSANLANKKQQFAQGELGSLYGMDTNAMLKAYGLGPENINAGTNAGKEGWFQNATSLLGTLGGNAANAIKAGAGG